MSFTPSPTQQWWLLWVVISWNDHAGSCWQLHTDGCCKNKASTHLLFLSSYPFFLGKVLHRAFIHTFPFLFIRNPLVRDQCRYKLCCLFYDLHPESSVHYSSSPLPSRHLSWYSPKHQVQPPYSLPSIIFCLLKLKPLSQWEVSSD